LAGHQIEETLEVQFGIGPLKKDAECIVRFTTSLSDATLVSDNNGIEMHKRPVASGLIQQNYYPMVAQSFISDNKRQFGLFSERTVGVASLQRGQVESMIHRRCSMDDGRGMGEALDDDTTVYPTFKLSFGSHLRLEKDRPNTSVRLQHRPRNFYASAVANVAAWTQNYRTDLTIMKGELPSNIHLLAFKVVVDSKWSKATVRIQHIFEKDTNPEVAIPVEVDLAAIFNAKYEVSEELELSGIVQMAKMPRMKWSDDHPGHENFWADVQETYQKGAAAGAPTLAVLLTPMQIKTYEFAFE